MEKLDYKDRVPTLKHLDLNQEEINLACLLINSHGCTQHPAADSKNFMGFMVSYLKVIIIEFRETDKDGTNLNDMENETLSNLEEKVDNFLTTQE